MDLNQFYPTPYALAVKAAGMFENKNFDYVLDPSAGNGDLLKGLSRAAGGRHIARLKMYGAEIDITRHARLREEGIEVVATDFLAFDDLSRFSHIIMNPPFNQGVKHVLHAWNGLWDGEIVAIINAETVKNQFSAERKLLVKLIKDHGSVEFIQDAFMDAERTTGVEVALVHLTKKGAASIYDRIIGDVVGKGDQHEDDLRDVLDESNQIAVQGSTIKNAVRAYNAALIAIKESALAAARAGYYMGLSGCDYLSDTDGVISGGAHGVRKQILELSEKLLTASWRNIVKITEFRTRLSSAAQSRFDSEIATISKLAFTRENIYSLLDGVVASSGQIQIEMMLDIFDEITKYYPDNRVHYKGWKSNAKHRSDGMKIKTTRFILPIRSIYGASGSLDYKSENRLSDFDKVFLMLDGKIEADEEGAAPTLLQLSRNRMLSSQRVSSLYFDVRFYPGAGTMHFYPKNKKLIDRLNRFVGRERNWIPDETKSRVSDSFWVQYDKAEKLDKEVRQAVENSPRHIRTQPAYFDDVKEEVLHEAIETVLANNGIDSDFTPSLVGERLRLTS